MKHGVITIYANIYYVVAFGNWIGYRTSRDLTLDFHNLTDNNLTLASGDNSTVNATRKRSDLDEFWLLRDDNATENLNDVTITESPTQMSPMETIKPIPLDDPEWIKEYEMNELLFMSRINCNLELQIREWEERKLKIQYDSLKNGMSGQCQISLRGKKGVFLAVLVSNVRLNGRKTRQITADPVEVLKIVTTTHHFNYTLREYRGNDEYYPVMLTESDTVYLILLFNGKNALTERSSYNLQVFNYYKNENSLNGALQDETHYGYGNSSQNIQDIFITTTESSTTN